MRSLRTLAVVPLAATLLLPSLATAEDSPQPAEAVKERSGNPEEAPPAHTNAYDAPALDVTVHGKRELKEEELIGAYKQPRWTAERRFPTTRVYVIPEGKFAVEYWLRATTDLSDFDNPESKEYRDIFEFEWGLGHRLQLDLYLVAEQAGYGPIELHKTQIELRYAVADYGEIWGNPTLYAEWSRVGGEPQALEMKLLLGGELTTGLHGAVNFVFEPQIWDGHANEYKIDAAVAKTIVDTKFSFGAEVEGQWNDEPEHRFDFAEQQYLAGPSLQWKPASSMNVLFTPLFGINTTQDYETGEKETHPVWRQWVVVGWEF